MRNKGKSGEGAAERYGFMGKNLRRRALVVGKRGVGPKPSTTPILPWAELPSAQDNPGSLLHPVAAPPVSARQLAAALWDVEHIPILSRMHRGGSHAPPPPPPTLSRHCRNRSHHGRDWEIDLPAVFADDAPSSSDQPTSAGSLRRHVSTTPMRHHLLPASSASYVSSLEGAPYKPVLTPSSSIDYKGRVPDSGYCLKTSSELLKVLNRIWTLEDQNTSNGSLVKALKLELAHAQARIKDLLREQQADQEEIEVLLKQITEDKLLRKSREMDRLNAAVQSVRDELEGERKLRKRSESLHRKLAQELSDLKFSLSGAFKELERERKSRVLLEDLCDEFARGIKDYQQQVHAMKQKSEQEWATKADQDRLILHIAESWLDERSQMRLAKSTHGSAEMNSVGERLHLEIKAFLNARRTGRPRSLHQISLESIPLNDAGDEEEDSVDSGSHCIELNKPHNANEHLGSNHAKKKITSHEKSKLRHQPSILQVKFEEQMAQASSSKLKKASDLEIKRRDARINNRSETRLLNSHHMCVTKRKNQALLSEGNDFEGSSSAKNHTGYVSPVHQWMSSFAPHDLDLCGPSSNPPPTLKDTLMEKLCEVKSRGPRARLKASKATA